MSEQVSHMGDGSEQADGSGEHRKGSVCGDGAESQEVFMERGGKSLGQEPMRHRLTDVATHPAWAHLQGPVTAAPATCHPPGARSLTCGCWQGPALPPKVLEKNAFQAPTLALLLKRALPNKNVKIREGYFW